MTKLYHILLLSLFLACYGSGFQLQNVFNQHSVRNIPSNRCLRDLKHVPNKLTTLTATSTSSPQGEVSTKKTANMIGYMMGAGSMTLYLPIILKLLQNKNATGYSLTTWVFNLLGLLCGITYPIKKGFPISTYVEMINAGVQSMIVLGLVSFYKGYFKEYLAGVATLAFLFGTLITKMNIPQHWLGIFQVSSTIISNYANIPQILLTFQTRKATWSALTATLCLVGCTMRIYTTWQLTKDKLVLGGYVLGLITNGILLAQIIAYG